MVFGDIYPIKVTPFSCSYLGFKNVLSFKPFNACVWVTNPTEEISTRAVLNATLLIGISLTAIYSFIFVIIQLENYALLVGSIGLFIILALVMFTSRKIDWQND